MVETHGGGDYNWEIGEGSLGGGGSTHRNENREAPPPPSISPHTTETFFA